MKTGAEGVNVLGIRMVLGVKWLKDYLTQCSGYFEFSQEKEHEVQKKGANG